MESIPGQLGEAGSAPSPKRDALKPNQVSETSLYGVPIVSLLIDARERLCLAQISNTLLKNYSYNEIHNRRVALGITCVQCTPVQLELLRRAGAMPISSRRCGMITKREAERLCKSFLGAHSPPKLPDNFAFDVSHECAWGCRGSFIPARYNSSRAKCIKCTFCSMYFSPNKFIFHSHRTPDSKYLQPDAANFNSWRRHLKLTEKKPSDDVNHAWEDVKAMFNGGSRKRTLPAGSSRERSSREAQASSALGRSASPELPRKTLRCDDEVHASPNVALASSARSYPLIPVPSKNFAVLPKIPPPFLPHHPYGFAGYGLCPKKSDGAPEATKTNPVPAVFWPATKEAIYPAFPVFWPAASGLPVPPYPASPPGLRQADLDLSDQSERSAKDGQQQQQAAGQPCPTSSSNCRNERDGPGDETPQHRKIGYISAFKPVLKDAETIAKLYGARDGFSVRPGYLSPDFVSETSSFRSVSPDDDDHDDDDDPDVDVDVESSRGEDDDEPIRISSRGDPRESPGPEAAEESQEKPAPSPEDSSEEGRLTRDGSPLRHVYEHEEDCQVHANETCESSSSPCRSNADGALRIDISVRERNLENMAKEELQKQLVEQMELRKKLEREFQHLKDNFQDQMKRELSYREEMVQQLQIVREAHDALHHFSCKMLTPRQCTGACTFKPPLLPP